MSASEAYGVGARSQSERAVGTPVRRRPRAKATSCGRWVLVGGGLAEVSAGESRLRRLGGLWRLLDARRPTRTLPLLSGALTVADPIHLTVGEVSAAVGKTSAVRLTLAEVVALGNDRYVVDLIVSALGDDAGPDEITRLEGYAASERGGALRVVLSGPAPRALEWPDEDEGTAPAGRRPRSRGTRLRLTAVFEH